VASIQFRDDVRRAGEYGTWGAVILPDGINCSALRLPLDESDEDAIERVVEATRVIREAAFPGVAPPADLIVGGGEVWLLVAMPPAPTLDDLLLVHRMTATEIAVMATDVGKTLQSLHQAGLAHGALTPRTIVLARSGAAVLTEVGLAGALNDRLGLATPDDQPTGPVPTTAAAADAQTPDGDGIPEPATSTPDLVRSDIEAWCDIVAGLADILRDDDPDSVDAEMLERCARRARTVGLASGLHALTTAARRFPGFPSRSTLSDLVRSRTGPEPTLANMMASIDTLFSDDAAALPADGEPTSGGPLAADGRPLDDSGDLRLPRPGAVYGSRPSNSLVLGDRPAPFRPPLPGSSRPRFGSPPAAPISPPGGGAAPGGAAPVPAALPDGTAPAPAEPVPAMAALADIRAAEMLGADPRGVDGRSGDVMELDLRPALEARKAAVERSKVVSSTVDASHPATTNGASNGTAEAYTQAIAPVDPWSLTENAPDGASSRSLVLADRLPRAVPETWEPDAEGDQVLRLGRGVPVSQPVRPTRLGRRPGPRRLILNLGLVIAIIAALIGLHWWTNRQSLRVTGVTVRVEEHVSTGCHLDADIIGTIDTAGGSGVVIYKWRRNDGTTTSPQSVRVQRSLPAVVHLRWSFTGYGQQTAGVALVVTQPQDKQAETSFLYRCGVTG
jgi:hypothetical protein